MKMEKRGIIGVFAILLLFLVAALAALYFLIEESFYKKIILVAGGIFLSLSMILLIIKLTSKEHKLKSKLARSNSVNSLEELKNIYKEAYGYYMKISENNKQNYFHKLITLRDSIEEKMHADKRLELLVQEVNKSNLEEKKLYKKMNDNFQKLPAEEKKKYSSHLTHLREEVGEMSPMNPENLKNHTLPPNKNGN